eukprot:COSAG02_NODE_969_length_15565_cov_9.614833_16_plen_65_part_00
MNRPYKNTEISTASEGGSSDRICFSSKGAPSFSWLNAAKILTLSLFLRFLRVSRQRGTALEFLG